MRNHYKEQGDTGWILKADIRKYFQNIEHKILLSRLERIIPDKKVMRLVEIIVSSHNTDTGKGLPIGSLTSQLFAIYYLDPLDRFVKERLRIKRYVRYMDDLCIIHHDKEYLKKCLMQMTEFVEDRLKLKFNEKTQILPVKNGIDFLGWHFYLTDKGKVILKLRQQNKKRIKKRLKKLKYEYSHNMIELSDVKSSLAATHGHLKHGHAYKLEEKVYKEAVFKRNCKEGHK